MMLLSDAVTQFALDMFRQFGKSKEDNIFFSPTNILSALGILLLGSRGNTKLQILKVLHLTDGTENTTERVQADHVSPEHCSSEMVQKSEQDIVLKVEKSGNVHHQFQKLLAELNKPTNAYELKITSSLYVENTFRFPEKFIDNIKKLDMVSVESVDFMKAPEESRKKINSQVEHQTNGKIRDLFPENSLNAATMVLANAGYFKGQWEEKFEEEKNYRGRILAEQDCIIYIMYIYRECNFALLEDVQAKALEIPYKGKELSRIVLLPNEKDGLQKGKSCIHNPSSTKSKLDKEWTSSKNMRMTRVHLYLPRFRLEESYDLQDTLKAMGMTDAFSARGADLSGMTGSRGLMVSKVLHKSLVEVTEEGVKAASATSMVISVTSSPIEEEFCCDHPFLFFIKQNKTNDILFLGRVSSP
uniref:Serpin domain-containing protein n=1 Tax=Otolemur garnettii TaxID=30611 RepID=H0X9C8_OTOGA